MKTFILSLILGLTMLSGIALADPPRGHYNPPRSYYGHREHEWRGYDNDSFRYRFYLGVEPYQYYPSPYYYPPYPYGYYNPQPAYPNGGVYFYFRR